MRNCTTLFPSHLVLLFLFAFGGFFAQSAEAQIVRINNEPDSVAFCSGFFVDQGVFNGPHGTGDPDTVTICSNSGNSDQTHILLSFTQIDLMGTMTFYNGPNTDAEVLTTFDADTPIEVFFIQANAANPSGCLTVVFEPDGSGQAGAGWNATISCVGVCQEVIANIGETQPPVNEEGYLPVCFGETVELDAATIYPQNGLVYDQSDETSTISWTMGDGTSYSGPNVSHTYQNAGGYNVQVFVTDINGCSSSNLLVLPIRVAPQPSFQLLNEPEAVCADQSFVLNTSTYLSPDENSNVQVNTEEVSFGTTLILADTTFLPDGPDDPEYATSLEFNNFSPGQVLEDINDLEGICLNMEHSYMGDLDIYIQCPDGTEAHMVNYEEFTVYGAHLGEPIDLDSDLNPGVGYDYCFTPDAELNWDEAVDQIPINSGESLPAGDYASWEPLEGLVGCPLNGEWTIRVIDNLSSDNGYIFSWSIGFNPDIYPDLERFTVGIDSLYFSDSPNITADNGTSIDASSFGAGPQAFQLNAIDEFGCAYDTTLTVDVLPASDEACYNCPTLLAETSADVSGAPSTDVTLGLEEADSSISVAWQVTPGRTFSHGLYPSDMDPFESAVVVSTIAPATIVDAEQDILSVCVDIETPATGDIQLFLRSPNGSMMALSTNNGGFGSDFSNTCFEPGASTSISDGLPPYSGSFQPEGDWSVFNGGPANGIWSIVAWDEGADEDLGKFVSWSITFRYQDELTYSWSPTDGLSCTDCPDPVLTLDEDVDQSYTLTVSNDRGCVETGEVNVTSGSTLVVDLVAVNPSCSDVNDGSISLTISGGTEPYSVFWSPDGDGTQLTDLGAGSYTATVVDANSDSVIVSAELLAPAPLQVESTIGDILCAGDSTGSISVTVTGGTGEYSYGWSATESDSSSLEQVPAGEYTLMVTDMNGCFVEEIYTINEPEPLVLMGEATDVACAGDSTGMVVLMVTGGTGSYSYQWSNGDTTPDLLMAPAGAYTVTVTDDNGCTVTGMRVEEENHLTELSQDDLLSGSYYVDELNGYSPAEIQERMTEIDTFYINQPDSLQVEVTLTDVQCVGDSTGSISLNVSGGTTPYQVMWNTEDDDFSLTNLVAGTYSATVIDTNGCSVETGDLVITGISQLSIELQANNPACNGEDSGNIALTVSGGIEPYSYSWSNDADTAVLENVGAGTYSATVTDMNGCSATIEDIELIDPPVLSCEVVVVAEPNTGNDGSLAVLINGGTGEYSIEWSNNATTDTISDLPAGTYMVVVTDENGCTTSCEAELQALILVSGYMWNDLNRDGIQNAGEPGFGERFVGLITPDGTVEQITTTDGSGRYEFIAPAGEYQVAFDRPSGYRSSPKNQGDDPALDSDVNANGRTDYFVRNAGEEALNIDGGFFDPCFPVLMNAGTIGYDQALCGSGNIPDEIVELTPAVNNGDGELNYMWMYRHEANGNWVPIPNTNSINFQPGPVYESTYFTRCVRRDECLFIESNVVLVEVGEEAVAEIDGPSLVCEGQAVTFTALGVDNDDELSWNFGPAANISTSNQASVTVTFQSFGQFQISLSVSNSECTASRLQTVSVTNNPNICGNRFGNEELSTEWQSSIYPNPTDGLFWLEMSGMDQAAGQVQIQLIDARGRLVAERQLDAATGRLQLDELEQAAAGLYMLRIAQGDRSESHRIVVR